MAISHTLATVSFIQTNSDTAPGRRKKSCTAVALLLTGSNVTIAVMALFHPNHTRMIKKTDLTAFIVFMQIELGYFPFSHAQAISKVYSLTFLSNLDNLLHYYENL